MAAERASRPTGGMLPGPKLTSLHAGTCLSMGKRVAAGCLPGEGAPGVLLTRGVSGDSCGVIGTAP